MSSSTFITEFLRSGLSETDIDRIFSEYDQDSQSFASIEDSYRRDCDESADREGSEAQQEAA